MVVFFFSSRRRHTRCALVTGVQTCALPISGEVSVSLAKLSFEQDIRSGQGAGGGQQPLLVIDPDDLATPQELAAKILASGETAATRPTGPAAEVEEVVAGDETDMPSQTAQEKLAALRERLAEDAESLQTRLTISSIRVSKNRSEETITRMLLDAQLRIASLAEDATAQEEAKSLDLTA